MKTDLHHKIKKTIGNSRTEQSLLDSVRSFCTDLGVDHFLFVSSLFRISNTNCDLITLSGNPEAWQNHYDASNYFESDVVVSHCRVKHTPLVWLDPKMSLDKTNQSLYAEAAEFGIVSGISFPYHGIGSDFGMFSGSISTKFKGSPLDSIETQHALYLLGASLFDLYTRDRGNRYVDILTQREKECLRWAARGKTSWEMSIILKISERTVGFHLDNAKTKLNTTTRTAAVSKALIHSLL